MQKQKKGEKKEEEEKKKMNNRWRTRHKPQLEKKESLEFYERAKIAPRL